MENLKLQNSPKGTCIFDKETGLPETLICKICGKECQHLGSHIWHMHHVLARDYKEEFGLPYDMSLISPEVKLKKQIAFEPHREKCLKNILENSEQYRFKKGQTGQRRISEHERRVTLERIKRVNAEMKDEKCPVCHNIYHHLDSHLQTKHKLLRIK